jgi:hypothetical protein
LLRALRARPTCVTSRHQIGQGYTNNSGQYTVRWNTLLSDPTPQTIKTVITTIHERFGIYYPQGQWAKQASPSVVPNLSSTQANPQDFGTLGVGSSALPNPYFNAYWAAEIQWRSTMAPLGVLLNGFTGVEVRGFQNTIVSSSFIPGADTCASSCTAAPNRQVQLDTNAGFAPQARIMHELGHVASYWIRTWDPGIDYTFDGPGIAWSQGSTEYGSASFEEAFATHFGNMTFWNRLASVTPTTCLTSSSHCYTIVTPPATSVPTPFSDFETSLNGATNFCFAGDNRKPINYMRFLWDVFDSRNDTTRDNYSAWDSGHYWQHASLMEFYVAGTGTNQHEEPWNSTKTTFQLPNGQPDGRGVASYVWNYFNRAVGVQVNNQQSDNCSVL